MWPIPISDARSNSRGQLDEALAEYRKADGSRRSVSSHNDVGNVLAYMGKPEEALAEYREAIRREPDLPFLYDSLGSVLSGLGRFSEAMNEFTNAARLDPAYPWPHFEMGKALLKQGRDAGGDGPVPRGAAAWAGRFPNPRLHRACALRRQKSANSRRESRAPACGQGERADRWRATVRARRAWHGLRGNRRFHQRAGRHAQSLRSCHRRQS